MILVNFYFLDQNPGAEMLRIQQTWIRINSYEGDAVVDDGVERGTAGSKVGQIGNNSAWGSSQVGHIHKRKKITHTMSSIDGFHIWIIRNLFF